MGRLSSEVNSNMKFVTGPDGEMLTLPDLPSPGTRRWITRRKAEVVAAVEGGLLSLTEACTRYALSVEEFVSWQQHIKEFGMEGLRATRQQEFRNLEHSRTRH
ncbi:MAG TPA: DUF1153 domain-containing protein [Rhizomicrobium sp.]|jgi:hypothetical protein